MTISELCKQGADYLEEAGNDNSGFDARCLMESLLKIDTTKYMLIRDKKADSKLTADFLALIRRRVTGEPLQYILGQWDFMGNTFSVGKGVLIPRPETELLVSYAEKFLKGIEKPIVFDLCSGSGCVAISVAKLFPKATVYAVEKSDEAFLYLEKNIKLNKVKNVKAVHADINNTSCLSGISADLILSNPPYIRSDEIPLLQKEVRQEPVIALDGGADGYDFYRLLAEKWLSGLKKGSSMAVECGEDQADEISQMFFLLRSTVEIKNDLSGFPRMVTAVR
jgi:release factor glutamine methyltransferase